MPAAPQPSDRPYVKLFTLTRGGRLDDTTEEHLRFIAQTYGWINSHGGSWRWPAMPAEMPFGRSAGVDALGRSAGDRLRFVSIDPAEFAARLGELLESAPPGTAGADGLS